MSEDVYRLYYTKKSNPIKIEVVKRETQTEIEQVYNALKKLKTVAKVSYEKAALK
jgi:acetolactate synthase small subunit